MAAHTSHARSSIFHFYEGRNRLLAEAHARPSTPLPSPTIATRIAALSGDDGADRDWTHMVTLCRRLGAAEPSPGSRWCLLDAGAWRLRWERHTEISTWTFYRPISEDRVPTLEETGLDLAPGDWLAGLPGEILIAAHIVLLRAKSGVPAGAGEDEIVADVADGTAQVITDFRPGPDAFTRIQVVQPVAEATLAGRIVQQLFEIETYRLLAMLAFPLAGQAAVDITHLESEAASCALQVGDDGGIEADRALLNRLATLAGKAQALSGHVSFRFSAARAYYRLVQERIQQLREVRIEARPTIGEFMERRLAPAMRNCVVVSERLDGVTEHIAKTSQLLSTRVNVATEVTNANLLASMDRRARLQLRLQQTVEGLSVAAISYYALGLLSYVFKAMSELIRNFDPAIASAVAAPIVIAAVWWALRRARQQLLAEDASRTRKRSLQARQRETDIH